MFIVRILVLVLLMVAVGPYTQAAIYRVSGAITEATGAMDTLTPPGTLVNGYFEFDSNAVASGTVGPFDVTVISIAFGGFCLGYIEFNCDGTPTPLTILNFVNVEFDENSEITGGLIAARVFAPNFNVAVPFNFDFDENKIWMENVGFGGASADVTVYRAVPLPATIWLMLMALMTLTRRIR